MAAPLENIPSNQETDVAAVTNKHEKQESKDSSTAGHSHKSTASTLVLEHQPVELSDDDEGNIVSLVNPQEQIRVMDNDSSKDLRNFDSALDNSMVLDKEINTTLERSRHNSPKKKNNDNATTRTFGDTDASTVTGTGNPNTADEATPAAPDDVMRHLNGNVNYARIAVQQQQMQHIAAQQQIAQQQQFTRGQAIPYSGVVQPNQITNPMASMPYPRQNGHNLAPNPNLRQQQQQNYMTGTTTPGNLMMQGENRTNGNDNSIVDRIANSLNDPKVQVAVGVGVVCVGILGYYVYKKIKDKSSEQVNQFVTRVGEGSWDRMGQAGFRRRRSLSAYHNMS